MNFFPQAADVTVRPTLAPKMRLFLSADIVGSTAYKQRQPESWFQLVTRFYRDAEQYVPAQWRSRSRFETDPKSRTYLFGGTPPELWKTIGDEVVFTHVVEHPWQVVVCITIWLEALASLREEVEKAAPALSVKSSAWLADFPLRNREVGLRTLQDVDEADDPAVANHQRLVAYYQNKPGLTRDFVGPSIDTGFRLGPLASPRRLAISLDLAHVLSGAHVAGEKARPPSPRGVTYVLPSCFYEGAALLKGVLGGVPYPQFWLDAGGDDLLQAEDKILRRVPLDHETIYRFTSAFIAKHADQFCAGLSWATSAPQGYEAHCEKLAAQLKQEESSLTQAEARVAERKTAEKAGNRTLNDGADLDLDLA